MTARMREEYTVSFAAYFGDEISYRKNSAFGGVFLRLRQGFL